MKPKKKGYYTLKELEKKYGKSQHTIRFWIRKGWLKAKQGLNKFLPYEYYVKNEDWLDFPTFKRNLRKSKRNRKNGTKE